MKYLLLLLALISIVFANRGRQITIWNPLESSPESSPVTSFKPKNLLDKNLTFRRDHLFTPAMSQDSSYQNPPHCGFGNEMYCNGKYFNYTLDGGQNGWGYDEFQNGLNYADGYGYGYGYDYYDGAYYDIPEKLCNHFPQLHQNPVDHPLNIPPSFQSGSNRDLYVKMAHFWQNLDNQTPLSADQCYTVFLDVRSTAGPLGVGLATRSMVNGHNHGFGHPVDGSAFNDTFVAFQRFASISNSYYTGGFVSGQLLNGTEVPTLNVQNLVQCASAGCSISTSYLVTIEVCNKTKITFSETTPLGRTPSLNYYSASQVFDIDLRGNGSVHQSLDVLIFGDVTTDVFLVTAKVLPKTYPNSDRVLYSTVMDESQFNPSTFTAKNYRIAQNGVFSNGHLSFTSNINYDEQTEPEELDLHQELLCFGLPQMSSGNDYLIDVGLFAESLPLELSGNHALAVGLRQGGQFVGFNRLGYYSDSLGNVITANISGDYLVDIVRQDRIYQNKPSNGIVQNSGMNTPLFNVKFSVYGKLGSGISVYAGTPDSPPYTLVWAAVEKPTINFDNPVSLCFYHQAEAAEDPWTPNINNQWKNITTIFNALTVSVENAEFGCDGLDLSGTVEDKCSVCGGNNECVGCDGKPYSNVQVDACGACGGHNQTCCTNRFGIPDSLWDWLLLPHIIEDVSQRLTSLSSQLAATCSLLDSFSNLCNPVSSGLVSAFNDIDLAKHQQELHDFQQNCLNQLQTTTKDMLKDVSVYVPLENFGGNL